MSDPAIIGPEPEPHPGSAPSPKPSHLSEVPPPPQGRSPSNGIPQMPKPEKSTSVTATVAVALVAILTLAGLLIWATVSTVGAQNATSWESIPSGQPYNMTPVTPKIPKSSNLTASQLPPMVANTPSTAVTLKVDPPPLGGNYGADGQIHDVFSPAFFTVPAGKTVHVTVYNYDDMWHTFTSSALGLNVLVPPGGDHPTKVTFSFTAPSSGNYYWLCAVPCDPYSMHTPGYMEGEVRAVSAH